MSNIEVEPLYLGGWGNEETAMDTAIVKTDANGAYNRYGEVVIPCKYDCGRMTTMTGTKACDFCWNNGGAILLQRAATRVLAAFDGEDVLERVDALAALREAVNA